MDRTLEKINCRPQKCANDIKQCSYGVFFLKISHSHYNISCKDVLDKPRTGCHSDLPSKTVIINGTVGHWWTVQSPAYKPAAELVKV